MGRSPRSSPSQGWAAGGSFFIHLIPVGMCSCPPGGWVRTGGRPEPRASRWQQLLPSPLLYGRIQTPAPKPPGRGHRPGWRTASAPASRGRSLAVTPFWSFCSRRTKCGAALAQAGTAPQHPDFTLPRGLKPHGQATYMAPRACSSPEGMQQDWQACSADSVRRGPEQGGRKHRLPHNAGR